MDWYLKAAELDDPEAHRRIGKLYQFGDGVDVDLDEALIWYKSAVKLGDINSNIAIIELDYDKGNWTSALEKINIFMQTKDFVNLSIYNLLGQEVDNIVNKVMNAGSYNINFNGENLTSGIYVAVIKTNNFSKSIKMTLLK